MFSTVISPQLRSWLVLKCNLEFSLSETETRQNAVDSKDTETLKKAVLRLVSKPISAQSFNLITAVRRDPSATKQYPSNNKDAFKYRDHRTQLPACFSYSAVISWGLDNGLCPVLSCVWCGGGSVQPGPSDVLRQQDVIEDPVREITACMEDVGDWRTNYRKCLMWLSSGTHSLLAEAQFIFQAAPVSLMPRLRQKIQWLISCVHHWQKNNY